MPATLQRPCGVFALCAFPAAGALYVAHVIGMPTYVGLSLVAMTALVASLLPERSTPRARPSAPLHTH